MAEVSLIKSPLASNVQDILVQLKKSGITYYSYGIQNRETVIVGFFSNNEWGSRYSECKLVERDPLVCVGKKLKNMILPWHTLQMDNENQYKVMCDRYKTCSLKSGLSFVRKDDGLFEIVAVGSCKDIGPSFFLDHKPLIDRLSRNILQEVK